MLKKLAFIRDDIIHALVMNYYRFTTQEAAQRQLGIIRDRYFVSHPPGYADSADSCMLWIKGFELSEAEKDKGFIGNFAEIQCHKTAPKQWGLRITKKLVDLPHPQRTRAKQPHPNWGHPILRSVDKKRVHPTLEAAQHELTLLQQEYAQVAVPGKNCLFIGIYGRMDERKTKRITRFVLEITPVPTGGYLITAKEKKLGKKPKAPRNTPPTSQEPLGYFTEKLRMKRERKKTT